MKKFILLIFFLNTILLNSQTTKGKWSVSLNLASVLYSEENASIAKGRLIYQFPRLTLSKYIGDKFSVTAAFASDFGLDQQNYTTFDLQGNYELFKIFKKINAYALGGVSLVSMNKITPTLNIGGGGTLWLSKNIGLNSELTYKFNLGSSDVQRSHIYSSVGIVYSFTLGRSKRIWNLDH